ncbi:thymidylate kinase [Erwiniaceae bacterium CAU 1747]
MKAKVNPPIIAIIGCDGSGKTTISEHLIVYINQYGDAVRVHLGKQAGNVERLLVRFPILGKKLGKTIDRKKVNVAKSKIGAGSALVMMLFVLRRLFRFRRMLQLRQRGLIILADRFPQIQIPGGYDGVLLPEHIPGSPFVNWLAGREHRAFRWMARHKPDLVLKLNVDIDVACARKPDHRRESLEKKVSVTSKLNFPDSEMVEIDVNQPLERVLPAAEQAVATFMQSRGYRIRPAVQD